MKTRWMCLGLVVMLAGCGAAVLPDLQAMSDAELEQLLVAKYNEFTMVAATGNVAQIKSVGTQTADILEEMLSRPSFTDQLTEDEYQQKLEELENLRNALKDL